MRQKICGVYLWTNLINGKMYVGVSIDIKKRWTQHKTESKTSKRYFYRAIRKYGIDNFNKTILETFDVYDRDKLKEREDYFINYYDSLNKGYNRDNWKDRAHFFAVAAQQLRRVLVDHARRVRSEKRGGGQVKLSLWEVDGGTWELDERLLALDESLTRLQSLDERGVKVS